MLVVPRQASCHVGHAAPSNLVETMMASSLEPQPSDSSTTWTKDGSNSLQRGVQIPHSRAPTPCLCFDFMGKSHASSLDLTTATMSTSPDAIPGACRVLDGG